jgi:hypothetical protein
MCELLYDPNHTAFTALGLISGNYLYIPDKPFFQGYKGFSSFYPFIFCSSS